MQTAVADEEQLKHLELIIANTKLLITDIECYTKGFKRDREPKVRFGRITLEKALSEMTLKMSSNDLHCSCH